MRKKIMNQIIYIMGVSGSGKTTVGKLLSQKMNIPFFDADDFHTTENKEKMKSGRPLNDEDREKWLQEINTLARKEAYLYGAVIACSALKKKYRILLMEGITKTVWIFLEGSYDIIFERLKSRQQHFMPAALLQSQFDILEVPDEAFCISFDKDPVEITDVIYTYLQKNKDDERGNITVE
jgi:carbohydrate kinase (thermoresistant glucokinase family)